MDGLTRALEQFSKGRTDEVTVQSLRVLGNTPSEVEKALKRIASAGATLLVLDSGLRLNFETEG